MKTPFAVAAAVLGLCLTGCGSQPPAPQAFPDPGSPTSTETASGSPLRGTTWRLTEVRRQAGDGGAASTGKVADGPSLRVRGSHLRFGTGCNDAGGPVRVGGSVLSPRDIAVTLRACSGAARVLERQVLGVLQTGPVSWSIEDGLLRLSKPGGDLTLVYTAQ